jgi:uncharacterized protein (DUF1697 family)
VARYAAFLRRINVSGSRIKAAELCAPFEALGLGDVQSFRASGNVVFDAPRAPAAKRIEAALETALGYDVAVFLRTGAEVRAIAAHDPFPGAKGGKLQVAFLQDKPSKKTRDGVLALASDADRLAFGARELYWLPRGGTQESQIDMKTLGKLLGTTTMRTQGTVEAMAAKYFAD